MNRVKARPQGKVGVMKSLFTPSTFILQADRRMLLHIRMYRQNWRVCRWFLRLWLRDLLHHPKLRVWPGAELQLQSRPEHRLPLRPDRLHELRVQTDQTSLRYLLLPAGVCGLQSGRPRVQLRLGLLQRQAGVHHAVLHGTTEHLWVQLWPTHVPGRLLSTDRHKPLTDVHHVWGNI